MRTCLLLIAVVAFPMLGIAYGEQTESKLAGAWALVEGVKEFAGERQPLTYDGTTYLVIRPNGRFYKIADFDSTVLDRLSVVGDSVRTAKDHRGEVLRGNYESEASELCLSLDDGKGGEAYEFLFHAKLRADGLLSLHTVAPLMGHSAQTITATLQRIDSEPLWQPKGMIAEWSFDSGSLSVDVSADGRRIVAADSQSSIVTLWNVGKSTESRQFAGHENQVCVVAISPDGRFIASGSRRASGGDNEQYPVRVWDVESGREFRRYDSFTTVTSLAFHPNGRFLLGSGTPPRDSHGPKLSACIWDVETGELELGITNDFGFRDAILSPDGKHLLVRPFATRAGNRLHLIDATTGNDVIQWGADLPGVYSMAFSPDGQSIATALEEPFVREWRVTTGEEVRRVQIDATWASHVVYLPNGRQILTANEGDNSICVWEVESGMLLKRFAGHRDHIFDLKVSADGSMAVSSSSDGTVRAWRLSPE